MTFPLLRVTGLRPLHLRTVLLALAALGCQNEVASVPRDDSTSYQASEGVRRVQLVGALEGFYSPEAVRYDPSQDVYFIASMLGFGSVKDNAGYIVRVDASELSRVTMFVESGRNGATLDAPKGMAIEGDTLWVNDIDVVRGFHRVTGEPLGTIDLRAHGAVLLNDIEVGPDGTLRITDSGIIMSSKGVLHPGGDKIFEIGTDGRISIVAQGKHLGRPNGIAFDPKDKRWLVVSFDPFHSEVYSVRPTDSTRTVLHSGKGKFDGVVVLPDGGILVSAWSDSSLHLFADGRDERIVNNLIQPADISLDTKRNRVAIPLVMMNRVEFWQLPRR